MNCELVFVRSGAEGEPGRVTYRKAFIELGHKGIEKRGVTGGGGGWGGA